MVLGVVISHIKYRSENVITAIARRSINVFLMLAHRLRRWPNTKMTLDERLEFAVMGLRPIC